VRVSGEIEIECRLGTTAAGKHTAAQPQVDALRAQSPSRSVRRLHSSEVWVTQAGIHSAGLQLSWATFCWYTLLGYTLLLTPSTGAGTRAHAALAHATDKIENSASAGGTHTPLGLSRVSHRNG
jgi:hypothetical protein